VESLDYFSKPKGAREQKGFAKTVLEEYAAPSSCLKFHSEGGSNILPELWYPT
jgi:hypothetical protein